MIKIIQLIIYFAIAVSFTLFGFLLCSLFTIGGKSDTYRKGYRDGYSEGKTAGYEQAYREFKGDTLHWHSGVDEDGNNS